MGSPDGYFVLVWLLTSPVVASPEDATEITVEFRLAELEPTEDLTEMNIPGTGRKIYTHPEAALTIDDIESAVAVQRGSQSMIEIRFTSAGAKEFARLTERRIGKPIAVLIDGKLVSAPVVQAPIRAGRAVITGSFTFETAQRIATSITAQDRNRNGTAP